MLIDPDGNPVLDRSTRRQPAVAAPSVGPFPDWLVTEPYSLRAPATEDCYPQIAQIYADLFRNWTLWTFRPKAAGPIRRSEPRRQFKLVVEENDEIMLN